MGTKRYIRIGLTFAAAASLASCSGGDAPSRGASPKPLFGFSPLSHPAITSVIGSWQTACMAATTGSTLQRIEVTDQTLTQTTHQFDDALCADAELDIISVYSVTGANTYSLRSAGTDIDVALLLVSTTLTPQSGYADILNELQLCGSLSWADGQAMRVESLSCEGYVTRPAGTRLHDYLEMTGSSFTFSSQTFSKID